MKKYIYILMLAMTVLILSGGCNDDDDKKKTSSNTKLMVITSPALVQGESYMIYRGDKVKISGTNAKYYVSPEASGNTPVTLNLQFADALSEDFPFVITTSDADYAAVIAYNPNGSVWSDITTEYKSVLRSGGGTQRLSYNGLNVSGASLNVDYANEIVIDLEAEKIGDEDIYSYEYVWHADPNHREEYYTKGDDTAELTEAQMMEQILSDYDTDDDTDDDDEEDADEDVEVSAANTLRAYIAHDIRYMSNTLNFEGLISVDGKNEYIAYYSESIQEKVAAELGAGFEGPYIFATLPMMSSDTASDAEVSGALNNNDVDTFRAMTHSAERAYDNRVLHIVKSGIYRLKGNWEGQIWLDPGTDGDITIILDNVTISCDVGPAIVFHNVRECDTNRSYTSLEAGDNLRENAGAKLIIADGSVNNISGTNLYRILKADKNNNSVTRINGRDPYQQAERYKFDGAIHSCVSLAVGAENNTGGGRLNITSTTYNGLSSQMHMLIDGGIITITGENDGISTNSVFTLEGGNISVTGKESYAIESQGYIMLNFGTLNVCSSPVYADDKGIVSALGEDGVYMSSYVTCIYQAYSSDDDENGDNSNDNEGGSGSSGEAFRTISGQPVVVHDENGAVLLRINYTTPVKDEETEARTVQKKGYIFELERRVNSFAGLKTDE